MKKKRLRPVHENIRRLRLAAELSQSQLGRLINEHKTVISHWENGLGAPRAEKLPLIAKHLGVAIDELFRKAA